MHESFLPELSEAQPSNSPNTAQRASTNASAGAPTLKQQPNLAEAEGEDTHDWESFNVQIERLLHSMQKSDRPGSQAQSSLLTPQQPAARSAGSPQPASIALALKHTALRQNLAETAFELAAGTALQALRDSEPSAGSGTDAAVVTAPRILQSYDASAADGELESHCSAAPAKALQQCGRSAHCNKAEATLGLAVQGRMTSLEHDGSASPYLPLLQQIDWHIASCDASLARTNTRAEACVPHDAGSQQSGVLSAETDGRAILSQQPALPKATAAQTEGLEAHNSGVRLVIEGPFCSACLRFSMPRVMGRLAAMQMAQ